VNRVKYLQWTFLTFLFTFKFTTASVLSIQGPEPFFLSSENTLNHTENGVTPHPKGDSRNTAPFLSPVACTPVGSYANPLPLFSGRTAFAFADEIQ